MIVLKWYNRDKFSDVDMRQAEAAANRLLGKKESIEFPWEPIVWEKAPRWAKDAKDDDLRREEK